jgi:hypothetical protein
MGSDLLTLFPILGVIALILIIVVFASWNRSRLNVPSKRATASTGDDSSRRANMIIPSKVALKPERATREKRPDTDEYFTATMPPAEIMEGFSASSYVSPYTPLPVSRGVFPTSKGPNATYIGPIIQYNINNRRPEYNQYAADEIYVSETQLATLNTLPIAEDILPPYGAAIGAFDSQVTSIPWDYDNISYLPKDVVWGFVSREASIAIFLKNYHRAILSEPDSTIQTDTAIMYHSPLLDVNTYDTASTLAVQSAEMAFAAKGSELLTPSRSLGEMIENTKYKYYDFKVQTGSATPEMKSFVTNYKLDAASAKQVALDAERYQNIQDKNTLKLSISEEDKLFQKKHELKLQSSGKGTKVSLLGKVATKLQKVGFISKLMAGARYAKAFIKSGAKIILKMLNGIVKKILTQMIKMLVISIGVQVMRAACTAAAIATAGALAWLAIIANIIAILWEALDLICMPIMLALSVIVPTLLNNVFSNGATCGPLGGKPLDQLIENDFLYFIVANILPIGGVLDVFTPFTCYTADGGIHMKMPLSVPAYFSDSTLSIYRHPYRPDQVPRGDTSSYTKPEDTIPKGWTLKAGIMREDCCCGTWTSSDVDALCNIASYVPTTHTKRTVVPATTAKRSNVPRTYPKVTSVMTTPKGTPTWVNPSVMTFSPCPAGQNDDGFSCWGCI